MEYIYFSLSLLTFAATLSNLSSCPKFLGRDVAVGVGNGCIVRAYENFTLIDN